MKLIDDYGKEWEIISKRQPVKKGDYYLGVDEVKLASKDMLFNSAILRPAVWPKRGDMVVVPDFRWEIYDPDKHGRVFKDKETALKELK